MRMKCILHKRGWLGRSLAVRDPEPDLPVSEPADADEDGDGCGPLEFQSNPAVGKTPLQRSSCVQHPRGWGGQWNPGRQPQRVSGPQVGHNPGGVVRMLCEIVLDLDPRGMSI